MRVADTEDTSEKCDKCFKEWCKKYLDGKKFKNEDTENVKETTIKGHK